MRKIFIVSSVLLIVGACGPKEYLKDWQAVNAPAEASKVVVVPDYPAAGRKFEVRRTFVTSRQDRFNRRTPPDGYIETLEVADNEGTLKFWRDGSLIHQIKLGKCFSFAKMDGSHDFAARGAPSFASAPPDCKIWDGREWHQTYRTLVPGWANPCVYEAKRVAKISDSAAGRVVHAKTNVEMTMENTGSVYNWQDFVEYDEGLGFFRKFNNNYIGTVEVLREIK